MLLLVSLFWNICLMREGPERVPTQQLLPGLIVIGKIVLVLLVGTALAGTPTLLGVATSVVVWTTTLACCAFYALFLGNKTHRFPATFAAILGIDMLLSAVFGTALIIQHALQFEAATFMNIVFRLWHLVIIGFIMHRALDINLGLGIGVGLVITIFCVTLTEVATL